MEKNFACKQNNDNERRKIMVKFTKEQYEKLKGVMETIKIPEGHKANVFWCPKVITKGKRKREGVILYIYGGHVVEIYANEKSLGASIFSNKYCRHFEPEKRGKEIRDEFTSANRRKNGIQVLENWSEEIWDEICNACFAWATKDENSEYERMRQTRICNDNMDNEELTVFTMEEKIFIEDKQPEVDMVAVRHEDGKTVISYIEYKCTESAMQGKCSIPKQYEAMAKISMSDDNVERMLELYYQKQEMIGKKVERLDPKNCHQEIVFLISNVQWKNVVNKSERRRYVSSKMLYNKLKETYEREDFRDTDVKVIILEDIDVKSKKSYVLNVKEMMDVKDAMELIRKNMEKHVD